MTPPPLTISALRQLPIQDQYLKWKELLTTPTWNTFMEELESRKNAVLSTLLKTESSHDLAIATGQLRALTECIELLPRIMKSLTGQFELSRIGKK